MGDPDGTQRPFLTAMHEVFASGDLVYLFKGCFTVRTFALNTKFLKFAKKRQMDIVPVAVRANVDLFEYQEASRGSLKLRISDIEWPVRMDPTANFDIVDLLISHSASASFQAVVDRVARLMIMANMLDTHAAHIRRLNIRMSLAVDLSDEVNNCPLYEYQNMFLEALAKCTAMETLVITQTDHAEKDVKLTTVQCRLFQIISSMKHLKVLDFCGNMTVDATNATLDTTNGTQNQLTMVDYLPPSLCELILRDGPALRMYKWREFYGFPAGLKLAMSNDAGRFPLLKSISLPSSFWSLMPHEFGGFVLYLNHKHVTNVGFSDPFKLDKGPFRPAGGYGHFAHLPQPKYGLHYLIVNLVSDMVIDIRGSDGAERAARIEWLMQITTPFQPILRSDGAGYTTITMHKAHKCTVRVLI